MSAQNRGYRDAAIDALAARQYESAGDLYTRAARSVLAEPRPDQSPFDADDRGWVGKGVQYHVVAAIAYRVAGVESRATRRAVEGVAVTNDLKHGLAEPVQHACLDEFVADLRVAGGLSGIDEAYESAAAAYESAAESVDQPQSVATTPMFEAAAGPLKQVARGQANGEIAIDWDDLHGSDPGEPGAFLGHRATYKRQRFPGLMESAVADGHLSAPRGTTEYGNENHRCPACGADDVNWSGNDVLCMRCSTPAEKV